MKNFKFLLLETLRKDINNLSQLEDEKSLRKEKALLIKRIKSLEKLFSDDHISLEQLKKLYELLE